MRDSKHPERPAIALAFSEWAAFMKLMRNAEWGDSFDLVTVADLQSTARADPDVKARRPDDVLL